MEPAATVLGGIALFTAFWLVYDGERVGHWIIRLPPARADAAAGEAAERAWQALCAYLRGVTIVALIDAVGIGVALVLIGVPLAIAYALTAGTLLYDIGGAVLAVPITAVVYAFVEALAGRRER